MADLFEANLYSEFETNALKILNMSGDKVREMLANFGEDLDAQFTAAWNYGGASFMRQTMSMTLLNLDRVFQETDLKRQLSEDEFNERAVKFDIGMTPEVIDSWYQQKALMDELVQRT